MASDQPMITYAQNREDVVLARALADVECGFYVDVGACDPQEASITRHFSALGWRGINVEPGLVYEKLAAARPRDVNLNVAASDKAGSMTFYEYPGRIGLSSLHERAPEVEGEALEGRIERTVAVRTLADIFAEHKPPTIDFMNIDTESHERQVLMGNDWKRWRPRIVLLEATLEGRFEAGHHLWEDVIVDAGYEFALWDGLNRFYVRREDAARLKPRLVPVNWLDNYLTPHQVEVLEESAPWSRAG